MTNSELREAAAKVLGWTKDVVNMDGDEVFVWYDRDGKPGCSEFMWRPDESHDQAALLLAEVERRGRQHKFSVLLGLALIPMGWNDWHDTWLIANATPEQKTRAAVEALTDGYGGDA